MQKLVGVVVLPGWKESESVEGEPEECIVLVAGGPLLQLWCGSEVTEHHLRRPLSEAFARAHLAPQGKLLTNYFFLFCGTAGHRLALGLLLFLNF